ncbi:MAG: hypothetical protein COW00_17895 [Bdellovibrio sp. CG12_big_fil_rev_8_21_14_0_65_39_13]|nr:MAG: hypothetical protein COW78_06275 [Bdellovibrio sp. CG22_combo_CG10-13_8_21_14_all_39_27]PIQ57981.1 MAG: hypothetical protein COW00_17895 [Bdellovibrio sp. CG12_big_fil_rev_8_21_14_0_65_39_13]PIR32884.1 MAG: hypothetical protein COV37_17445 [Bdellovibrio sp. CG11_big_fil_rev_8_21_14_0_20_39_38]
MQYALVNGIKSEASPNFKGLCICCGNEMISKCGKKIIWHWAHKTKCECDLWWENETIWHRDWKSKFPKEFHEIINIDDLTGEKHIADIKLNNGLVIEFQNSRIKEEEVLLRNNFYKNILWVVNGLSLRESDYREFCIALDKGNKVNNIPLTYLFNLNDSKIAMDWADCNAPVLFDFSEEDLELGKVLWLLIPTANQDKRVVVQLHFDDIKNLLFMDLDNNYMLISAIALGAKKLLNRFMTCEKII